MGRRIFRAAPYLFRPSVNRMNENLPLFRARALKDKDAWPELVLRLRDLKYRVRRVDTTPIGFELYTVNLSEWRLSLSEITPIIWVNSGLLARFSPDELAESLLDVVRANTWRNREVLVLLDGDGQELKAQVANRDARLIVVNAADQRQILAAGSFTNTLQKHICEQIPISSLAPYEYGPPVEGARFFGRKREINDILRHDTTSFAIMGVRRIGKTSLLNEIERRMIEQGEKKERIVRLDCSTLSGPVQFVEEVVRKLNIRELPRLKNIQESLFSFPNFLKRMSKMHGGMITIFLDEADPFLSWARDVSLPALRDSMTSGACRYIMAGFQAVMSEWSDNKSPFYWAFRFIDLGPFEKDDVEEIVRLPARSLHLRIEDEPAFIARLQADTRGHPYLIQYCCVDMMRQLERESSRVLNLARLDGVYTSEGFKSLIISSFMDNVAVRDKVLVYALLRGFPTDKDAFTESEIYGALSRQHTPYPAEEVFRVCHRLTLAAVLVRDGPKYQFAFPVFPRVLRANHDLDHLLSVAKKEIGL